MYCTELFEVAEVLLADLLPLRRVQIEFVEGFVKELVCTNHPLLELGEAFGELELLQVGEGARGGRGGADVAR